MTALALVLVALAVALLVAVATHTRRRTPSVAPRRPVRRIRTDVPHVLYHYCYAGSVETIYWGISNDEQARADRHETDPDDRWWMAQSDRLMRIDAWYPNRTAARAAERGAIRAAYYAGHRIANYQHNPGRRRVTR